MKGVRSRITFLSLLALQRKVREAAVALDDGEFTLIALNGLDSSDDAFVMTYIVRTKDIPFVAFQGMLQAHEACSMKPLYPQIPMANVVQGHKEC